jgi:hypothetical protein
MVELNILLSKLNASILLRLVSTRAIIAAVNNH